MGFMNYPNNREPWESLFEYESRIRTYKRAEEEHYRSMANRSMLSPPPMRGISERDESYQEFCARIDRERDNIELQRTKDNTKKLILLL